MRYLLLILILSAAPILAQTETLTNAEIIEMAQAGLGKELIIQKIQTSNAVFDVSAKALVELKKANVSDEIVSEMMEKSKAKRQRYTQTEEKTDASPGYSDSGENTNFGNNLTPAEMLRNAKTIAIKKASLHPTQQNLEKELFKRNEWKDFHLSITEYQNTADLRLEIGHVPLTIFTHRYVFRIVDVRSGTVIAAGETTSWGSLAENMSKRIVEKLKKVLERT
jgi:hypothetical protein